MKIRSNRPLSRSIAMLSSVVARRFLIAAFGVSLPLSAMSAGPGDADPSLPNPDFDQTIFDEAYATAIQPDGRIIFSAYHDDAWHLHRTKFDGTLDPNFDFTLNSQVNAVAVQRDGKILVGGSFSSIDPAGPVGATTRMSIARLNTDGTLDTAYDPNANSGASVNSFIPLPDGKLYVGGSLGTLQPNGAASATITGGLARLNEDGTVDTSFAFPKPSGAVYTLALQGDGNVLVGGTFSTITNNHTISQIVSRNRIARVQPNGELDDSFDPKANSPVMCIAVQADGKILVGGSFTTLQPNGAATATAINRLARLNADGTVDTSFSASADGQVRSVALQADGKIVVGGSFTTASSFQAASTVRLNANGTRDFSINLTTSLGSTYGVMIQPDGKILACGSFTYFGGRRSLIGRVLNQPATQSLTAPDSSRLVWSRGGSAGETYGVGFELSTDGGETWSALGNATRVGTTADWELTGLSLPPTARVRAVANIGGARFNGSSGLAQFVAPIPADSITLTPTLDTPATGTTYDSPVNVSYTLPEKALGGSVELKFNNGSFDRVIYLTGETAGTHTFSFDRRNPASSPGVSSGVLIPDGTYTVSISYQDEWGNPRAAASTSNVSIDAAPETIIVRAPAEFSGGGTTSRFASFVLNSDDANVTYQAAVDGGAMEPVTSPLIFRNLALGSHTVQIVATDSTGHTDPTPATYTWTIYPRDVNPVAQSLVGTKLDPAQEVPTLDNEHRIGAGATWTGFGSPAIDDAGTISFIGKWKSTEPAEYDGKTTGVGIFSGTENSTYLKVAVGEYGTDANGEPADTIIKSLKDPVASTGGITFGCTVDTDLSSTAGVVAAQYYLSHATGRLLRVAQVGQEMPGRPGSQLKAITSASIDGTNVLITGTMKAGFGGVLTTNDSGAWLWSENGTFVPAVLEGDAIGGSVSTVKTFNLLKTAAGSPGTSRGQRGDGAATFAVTFADGGAAIVDASASGANLTYVKGLAATESGTASTWKAFGPTTTASYSDGTAFLGTLNTLTGQVTAANAKRLFFLTGNTAVVTPGDAAPGLPAGNLFTSFNDPIVSPGGNLCAFLAKAKLGTLTTQGIWTRNDGGALQNAIAYIGGTAPSPATGQTWRSFTSLAASDFGPIFTAKLSDLTTGLWAVDSTGTLRQLIRSGDTYGSKTVKTINILNAVAGSNGTRRAFTADGLAVAQVTFVDGGVEIITIEIP